jgi:formamidopyrimidine-DNA glycosylase
LPELPEVEAVVRKLRKAALGAKIADFRAFRPRVTHPQSPAAVQKAVGCAIRGFERRGKHIIVRLDKGLSLNVHLKLSGNLTVIPDARLHASTVRALFAFRDGRALVLDDRRALAGVNLLADPELEEKLSALGIDPLSRAFTVDYLLDVARRSRKPAKLFLMEQYPISGMGNIYSAEALFRARIHPSRDIATLRRPKIELLHSAIRTVLREAVPAAVRSYKEPGLHEGMNYFVYGRKGEPCKVCGRAIARVEQAGRSTYFCPSCQR